MEYLDSRNQWKAAVILGGLAEAVLDVHSAHTNFATKKHRPQLPAGLKPVYHTRGTYMLKGARRMVLSKMSAGEKRIGRKAVLTGTGLGG